MYSVTVNANSHSSSGLFEKLRLVKMFNVREGMGQRVDKGAMSSLEMQNKALKQHEAYFH